MRESRTAPRQPSRIHASVPLVWALLMSLFASLRWAVPLIRAVLGRWFAAPWQAGAHWGQDLTTSAARRWLLLALAWLHQLARRRPAWLRERLNCQRFRPLAKLLLIGRPGVVWQRPEAYFPVSCGASSVLAAAHW